MTTRRERVSGRQGVVLGAPRAASVASQPDPPTTTTSSSSSYDASSDSEATQEVSKKEKRPRTPATMGWRAAWSTFFGALKLSGLVLGPNKKERKLLIERERENHEASRREAVRTDSVRLLNELTDKVPALTVAFIGVKGGASTTTTFAHAASALGDNTRTTVVASDFNPAQGTGAARLGKDYDQTVTLRRLLTQLDSFKSFKEFIGNLRATQYSVRVISANDITAADQHMTGEDAEKMLATIGRNTEYHFIDTANDITNAVTLEVVRAADVLVFTANVQVHDSLRQLGTAMQTLRNHGFRAKVDASIVVVSNLEDLEDLGEYRRFLNRVNIQDVVVQELPGFGGVFMGVPTDPIIKRDTEVALEPLAWATYQAYLDLCIAVLEQGLALAESNDNSSHSQGYSS